jgi:predicted ABC-type transport system involved in lysophospholipase L1 biosynthesis ATPase subunit
MSGRERMRLRRTSVAFIFQSFGLIPILSAAENVGVPLVAAYAVFCCAAGWRAGPRICVR